MKLLFKITGIFAILLALSMSFLAVYSYQHSKTAMDAVFEGRMHSLLDSKAGLIRMYLSGKKESISCIADDKGIVDMLAEHPAAVELETHHEESREYLAEKWSEYGEFDELFILTPEGEVDLSTEEKNTGKIFSGEDFFIEGKKGPYIQKSRYDLEKKQPVIFVSAPVKSREGKLLGVAAGKLGIVELSNILNSNRDEIIGEKSYLINEFNYIIAETGKNSTAPRPVYTSAAKKCISGGEAIGEEYLDENGKKVISAYMWIPEAGACLLTEAEGEKVFSHLKSLRINIIIAGTASGILFVLVGFMLSRRFTRRILELLSATQKISAGKFVTVSIKSKDELHELAEAFSRMSRNLEYSRSELENYAKNLAKIVSEKTKMLERKKAALEKSEKAAYNMMEDLNDANKGLEDEKRSIENKVRERTIELQKAYDELKVLDRQKEEFISMISHELKTPLFPIIGYVNMVLDGKMGAINPLQKEKFAIVAKSAANLNRLVEDMLDMSKLELKKLKLDMQKENIAEIAKEAVEGLSFMAKNKNLSIEIEAGHKVEAECDRKRIMQVIDNFITNAIKFTKAGGHITLKVWKDGSNALISVKDNGIGMSADGQKQLFNRFYQVKKGLQREYGGGTGLGLAISRGIVELHKGKIFVESAPNRGSVFRLSIPVKSEAEEKGSK